MAIWATARRTSRHAAALIEDVTLGLCRLPSIAVIAPHAAGRLSGETPHSDDFGIGYFGETSVRASSAARGSFARRTG